MSEDATQVTREEMQAAVSEGMKSGIAALAAALRSGQPVASAPVSVRTGGRTTSHPLVVTGLVIALLGPLGGGALWLMSLQSRVAVLEAQSASLQTASSEIAALKQELTDFRGEFRDWKDNQRRDSKEGTR